MRQLIDSWIIERLIGGVGRLVLVMLVVLLGHVGAGAQPAFEIFKSFQLDQQAMPLGPPVIRGDGTIFGIVSVGGGQAIIIRSTPPSRGNGWGGKILHRFDGPQQPSGGLLLGADGALYGTTRAVPPPSESARGGYAFRLTETKPGKWNFRNIARFNVTSPQNGLAEDSQGNLYGSTHSNGRHARVVRLERPEDPAADQWPIRTIYTFTSSIYSRVRTTVIFKEPSTIFGIAQNDGEPSRDVIFRLRPKGDKDGPWTRDVIYRMGYQDWRTPPIPDSAGGVSILLYGLGEYLFKRFTPPEAAAAEWPSTLARTLTWQNFRSPVSTGMAQAPDGTVFGIRQSDYDVQSLYSLTPPADLRRKWAYNKLVASYGSRLAPANFVGEPTLHDGTIYGFAKTGPSLHLYRVALD